MFKTLINIFRVPELRNKVLFTLFMLAIYRIGYHIPIPGVNQDQMAELAKQQGGDSVAGRLASYVSLFSGGNLSQSTIFGLGITSGSFDVFGQLENHLSIFVDIDTDARLAIGVVDAPMLNFTFRAHTEYFSEPIAM